MKAFMDENFLLDTETAQHLYHDCAAHLPIIDYHCHLSPQEIYEDRRYETITQVWLGGDHYKWRQMRTNGIPEDLITGNGSDYDKFLAWAETLERAIGNPLYHWSHLELQRYFGYHGHLSHETAKEVWDLTKRRLAKPEMSARGLIRRSNVKVLCTTDDPIDSLSWHKQLAADPTFEVTVLPAWRPDRALDMEKPDYPDYLRQLSEVSGTSVTDFTSLITALKLRMDAFAAHGCRLSDHGLREVPYAEASVEELNQIVRNRLNGTVPTPTDCAKFQTGCLMALGREYRRRNWVMQLHFGVVRDLDRTRFRRLGPDTGFDSIGDAVLMTQLAHFLNALSEEEALPKTILYSLNPNDNAAIDTLIGCFQDERAKGTIQHGAAWWFNDHKQGMEAQLTSLASLSLLGNFIGMLTDSRSFLSYTRHEYFRRILCGLIGRWVENGEYPNDEAALKRIIEGICCNNAMEYFQFNQTN